MILEIPYRRLGRLVGHALDDPHDVLLIVQRLDAVVRIDVHLAVHETKEIAGVHVLHQLAHAVTVKTRIGVGIGVTRKI